MRNLTVAALCLSALLGCTSKMQDVTSTAKAYYDSFHDIELSKQEIDSIPYASAYLRLDDGQQIFIVVAYADINPENGAYRLTWVASDKATITTENGRIVKTGFLDSNNLEYLGGANAPVHQSGQWQATYDWQPSYASGFTAEITPAKPNDEVIESTVWKFSAQHYQEHVTFANNEFTNHYWVDGNQKVVKTIQYIGPEMRRVEMTLLKTFQ